MKFIEILKTAWQSLLANPKRSFLTMIGIIIGIAAVITIVSLGNGVKKRIYEQFKTNSTGEQSTTIQFRNDNLTSGVQGFESSDLSNIAAKFSAEVKDVKISHEIDSLSTVGQIGNQSQSMSLSLLKKPAKDVKIIAGKNITREDLTLGKEVALISKKVADDNYGYYQNTLNTSVYIGNVTYRVIGVYETQDQYNKNGTENNLGVDFLLPEKLYYQGNNNNQGNSIKLTFDKGVDASKISTKIEKYLQKNGSQHTSGKYYFIDIGSFLKNVSSVIDSLTVFISAIAAISLFIAGIGVMNMMYISVSERTQEIGIRLAIGATPNDIMLQFLIEAIVLTVCGGLIGFILGWLLGLGISPFLPNQIRATMTLSSFLLAFGVSTSVGIIFGILPARQASKKNLIDILR